MQYRDLTTAEVKAKLDRGESFKLIDVREPVEHSIGLCCISRRRTEPNPFGGVFSGERGA